MTLEFLMNESNKALKEHLNLDRTVLVGLVANIKKAAIDKGCKDNITEELVNEVILKELKITNEQIETCPKDRQDKLCGFECKKAILEKYAPKIITDEKEIKILIFSEMASQNLRIAKENINTARKILNAKFKGKVDQKTLNKLIGELFI